VYNFTFTPEIEINNIQQFSVMLNNTK